MSLMLVCTRPLSSIGTALRVQDPRESGTVVAPPGWASANARHRGSDARAKPVIRTLGHAPGHVEIGNAVLQHIHQAGVADHEAVRRRLGPRSLDPNLFPDERGLDAHRDVLDHAALEHD